MKICVYLTDLFISIGLFDLPFQSARIGLILNTGINSKNPEGFAKIQTDVLDK